MSSPKKSELENATSISYLFFYQCQAPRRANLTQQSSGRPAGPWDHTKMEKCRTVLELYNLYQNDQKSGKCFTVIKSLICIKLNTNVNTSV